MLADKPPQEPLTPEECRRIWAWEWWTVRVGAGALAALAVLFLGGLWLGGDALARKLVIVWFLALIPIGIVVPLRETCPRCRHRLSQMWRFQLPTHCSRCGVPFPKREAG